MLTTPPLSPEVYTAGFGPGSTAPCGTQTVQAGGRPLSLDPDMGRARMDPILLTNWR